ncbi:right-handed parallel beta-helix repeat-containing protein [Streptacidiphilus sp. PB12-B1b]|uniref:right-handed parallel beta-helix repeat-containing protein n=1 Tax=Streptacidiphilus sp. PB12-B1b TaxID=2705012 RepID=UPI0015FBC9E1|nr:right-handed parallel beta-helix repeat-containing protein [Streptacidiphilus sp. PB12-B1b]QMU75770.1 right-handed parallel beta-helix repeat-containing protein [Streptacidiphilus sp. PB12-B1b]
MRSANNAVGAATVVLLLSAVIPAVSGSTTALADSPALPSTLYVSGISGCSNSGSGTQTQPYCTISAAAAVVQAGQTVLVAPGAYNESVDITGSGTASAPITFLADNWLAADANWSQADVEVGDFDTTRVSGAAFTLSGAQHVVVRGFQAYGGQSASGFLVENSSDVTLDQGSAFGSNASAVHVTGTSSGVTVSRLSVQDFGDADGAGVQIDAGVTGAVVSTDTILRPDGVKGGAVLVSDAPGTVVTSNTMITNCSPGVVLAGASSGASVENNIIETGTSTARTPGACKATADATAINVAAGSTSGTTVDYNLVDPASGSSSLYAWAGTGYPDSASFASATAQGAADLSAAPQLTGSDSGGDQSGHVFRFSPAATSPAIDSADANAPGELPTDTLGNPRQDDPAVANTGTGGTRYFDRGAVELQGPQNGGGQMSVQPVGPADPLAVTVTTTEPTPTWTTNAPLTPTYGYLFDDDPFPVTSTTPSITHAFARAGQHAITTSGGSTAHVVVGADYTPVAPTRLLDTRNATGVATTTPVAPGADVVLPIPAIDGVPAAHISAVVANVTVTQPTATGFLTVYPHGESLPTASNLNFTKGETVPNLVTVPVTDGSLVFHNSSSGTVHILMDLQGFYGQGGYGFKPLAPTRVLDTRAGLGATAAKPIPADGTQVLDLSKQLPSGATAAVLNLTVTQPSAAGHLTAYPDGQALPNVSDLNFSGGQTVPNLVTVPVTDGKVDLHNASGGTTHLIADLEGYFGTAASGATQAYVPYGPTRDLDTRSGLNSPYSNGAPVPAHATVTIWPYQYINTCLDSCPTPTGAVLNVTATQPKAGGDLTLYANGQKRPTSSNINFTSGQTVPNLVTVPLLHDAADDETGAEIYNNSSGSVQIVVDEEGYYIQP